MRVGNAQPLQDALDTAILAPAAMQRIETDIGPERVKTSRQVKTCVHLDHLIKSCLPQGEGA